MGTVRSATRGAETPFAIVGRASGALIPDELTSGLVRLGLATREVSMGEPLLPAVRAVHARLILLSLRDASRQSLEAVARCAEGSGGLVVVLVPPSTSAHTMADFLAAGADLCFNWDEDCDYVVASIEAAIRKNGGGQGDLIGAPTAATIRTGGIVIDFGRHQVLRDGNLVNLSPTEFRVVAYLAAKANAVCSAQEIAQHIYPDEISRAAGRETVKMYVSRIRQKLEATPSKPEYVLNVRGFGYLLRVPEEEPEAG